MEGNHRHNEQIKDRKRIVRTGSLPTSLPERLASHTFGCPTFLSSIELYAGINEGFDQRVGRIGEQISCTKSSETNVSPGALLR